VDCYDEVLGIEVEENYRYVLFYSVLWTSGL